MGVVALLDELAFGVGDLVAKGDDGVFFDFHEVKFRATASLFF